MSSINLRRKTIIGEAVATSLKQQNIVALPSNVFTDNQIQIYEDVTRDTLALHRLFLTESKSISTIMGLINTRRQLLEQFRTLLGFNYPI